MKTFSSCIPCVLLFLALFLIFSLAGCKDSHSSSETVAIPEVEASLSNGLPVTLLAGNLVPAVIRVTNLTRGDIIASIVVFKSIKESTTGPKGSKVDLLFDRTSKAGPGGACWNGNQKARLGRGQYCFQTVGIYVPEPGEFESTLTVTFSSAARPVDVEKRVRIKTHFVNRDLFQSENTLHISPLSFRPNTWTRVVASNTTPTGVVDSTVKAPYIDLSGLSDALFSTIDKKNIQGGVYYPDSKRIIFNDIPVGTSVDVSFFVKGEAHAVLQDSTQLARLENNETSHSIVLGAVNVINETSPQVRPSLYPFIIEQDKPAGDIKVQVPENGASLEYTGMLPDTDTFRSTFGVRVTPQLNHPDTGDRLLTSVVNPIEPADSMTFRVELLPEAKPGRHVFTGRYRDNKGNIYEQEFSVEVDNTSSLAMDGDFYMYRKHKDAVYDTPAYIDVFNNGRFNIQFPADLNEQFSISGGGMSIRNSLLWPFSAGDYRLALSLPSCANYLLHPMAHCLVPIVSTDTDAVTGNYEISVIPGDNLKAARLGTVILQDSAYTFLLPVKRKFPEKIKSGEPAFMEMEIRNQGALMKLTDLDIQKSSLPDNSAIWKDDCNLAINDVIPAGTQTSPSVKKVLCEVKGNTGVNVSLVIKATFNGGSTSFTSDTFRGSFVDEAELANNLVVNKIVDFSAGADFSITFANTNGTSPMQSVALDLGGLDAEFRKAVTLYPKTGVSYDPETGKATFADDIQPNSSQTLKFHFPLTPGNKTVFDKEKARLTSNTSTPVVKIVSNSSRDAVPQFKVSDTILDYPVTSLDFPAPESKTLAFGNPTDKDLALSVVTPSDPHLKVTLKSGSIQARTSGGEVSIETGNGIRVGVHEIKIQMTDSAGHTYMDTLRITVPPATLQLAGGSTGPVNAYVTSGTEVAVTDVTLLNENPQGKGYAIYDVKDIGQAFELRDALSSKVAANKVSIKDGTRGSSLTEGLPYNHVAVIGIEILDKTLPPGDYALYTTTNAGNLPEGQKLADIRISAAQDYLALAEQSQVPDKVLPGKTFTWQATLTNIDPKGGSIGLRGAALINTTVEPHQRVPLKNGGVLWSGTVDKTLAHNEKASIAFDQSLATAGEHFQGYLEATFIQGHTQHTRKLKHFSTEAVSPHTQDELYINKAIENQTENIIRIEPDGGTVISIKAGPQGLNNLFLDLSDMKARADLYAEILAIKRDGVALDLPATPGVIALGSLVSGGGMMVTIDWKGSAESVLKKYYQDLITNPTTHLVAIGAANSRTEHPVISVSVTPLELSNMLSIHLTDTNTVNVTFTNTTQASMILTSLDKGGLDAMNITVSGGDCLPATPPSVLDKGASCHITLTAASDVYRIAASDNRKVTLHYKDEANNTFSRSVDVTTAGVSVAFSGNHVPHSPHSGAAAESYVLTLKNTGVFTLRTGSGTVFNLLSGPATSSASARLTDIDCNRTTLDANAVCQFRVNIFDTDSQGTTGDIVFSRGSSNLEESQTAFEYSIAGTIGWLQVNRSGAPLAGQVVLKALSSSVEHLSVRNIGDQALQMPVTAVRFSWNQGGSLPAPVISGSCQSSSAFSMTKTGPACTLTLTGSAWPPTQSATLYGTVTLTYTSNNQTRTRTFGVEVRPAVSWLHVACSGYSTCALTTRHKIYCWGSNNNGQLGVNKQGGILERSASPLAIDVGNLQFNRIYGGHRYNFCAIERINNGLERTRNGLYCWGYNNELFNYSGDTFYKPTYIHELSDITEVAIGQDFMGALDIYGRVWLWGDNSEEQLTYGSSDDRRPEIQSILNDYPNKKISATAHTACANSENFIQCWGSDEYGQLGMPYNTYMVRRPHGLTKVSEIAGKINTFCAVNSYNEKLYCWGYNIQLQTGYGWGTAVSEPKEVPGLGQVKTDPSTNFRHIDVSNHGCAIQKSDSQLYCWGNNVYGQLGHSASIYQSSGSTVSRVQSLGPVKEVATGEDHTCAITADSDGNRLFCWGRNRDGELGIGNIYLNNSVTPLEVPLP